MITLTDTNGNFESETLDGALEELFAGVGDGKNLLEAAITDKGGTVSKSGVIATFAELESGIQSISGEQQSGMLYASGTAFSSAKGSGNFYTGSGTTHASVAYKISVNGLAFKPRIIRYRKTTQQIQQGYDLIWSEFGDNVIGDYNYLLGYATSSELKVAVQNNTTGEKYQTDSIPYVDNTSFVMPADVSGINYEWEVWG
ncbi:hypothetical protein [Bacillus benzoevorans]|uniref:Uncharacterized protein n=1 Tax=Bacillus benzoevorans TaxID=1456 RepID=A0A7X0HT95_9BACI|nr:hypothetical protein [Bacillus benzoevorans]MBB6446449.1 hypothetical protein [Bacillus benzoevorans]